MSDNWNELQLMIKKITHKNNIKPTLKYYVIHSAQSLMPSDGVCVTELAVMLFSFLYTEIFAATAEFSVFLIYH